MALIVEAVGQSGVVERITVEGGAAVINAQPGLTYRILDASGRPVNASATVRRVGDHLIIEGLPEETTIQLADFFFVCTPSDPCSLDLEGLGGARGETINQISEPIAALADGSFVLHAPASMATPVAPEAEFSAKPALAGLALLGLVGGGGGGGGGGDGPPPPPPGSTTVTSPPYTNDSTPVIRGTAVPGAQITVTLDIPGSGPVTFNTIADGNGNWSIDTGTAAPTAGAMPADGIPVDQPTTVRILTAGSSQPITYQLAMDLVPPAPPMIEAVTGDDIINADEAREANPSPITVSGTAEPGSTVLVSWHGDEQPATADADGRWSVTFDGQLIPDGPYVITAVATDVAGNASAPGQRSVTVETGRPSAPNFNDVAADNIINAAETNDGITITGTTSAGTQVFVSIPGLFTDRPATVSGTTWSLELSPAELQQLPDGQAFQVTAYANDGVNQSVVGASDPVLVDRTPPAAPTIVGPVEGDNIVNAAEAADGVTVSGTAEPGTTVRVSWGDTTLPPVNVDANGNWTAVFAPGQVPGNGNHTVSATAIDAAGNSSAPAQLTVGVDTTVAAPTLALASDTGSSNNDGITNVGTINVGGLEAGATWQFSTDGGANWTAGTGTSFTLAPNTYAANSVQVRQTDAAGNVSEPRGNTSQIIVDTTPPPAPTIGLAEDTGAPNDGITSNGTVNVGGLEPGARWEYSTNNGSSWTAGTGSSFVLPAGDYAANIVQVRQIDVAGNTGAPANLPAVQVISAPPPAPSIALANDTGSSGIDGITNDATVNVGLAPGVIGWEYSLDGGSTWTAGSGSSFELTPGTTYGPDQIQARQINAAGLTGAEASIALEVTVDVTAPGLTGISDNFEGVADGDIVISFGFNEPVVNFDINDLAITGLPAGSIPSLDPAGGNTFNLTIPVGLDQAGEVEVSIREDTDATDVAGNPIPSGGLASQEFDTTRTIAISDLFDDAGPTTGSVANGLGADDDTPTITVTLTGPLGDGESVVLYRNGVNTGVPGSVAGTQWTFTDSLDVESMYTYTARIESAGGGMVLESAPWQYNYSTAIT